MSEPFLGQIIMFGGNFAIRGFALCDGQLLSISSNTALFSLLGTVYGGDGRVTFALPDLRGRFALHPGNGPGLPSYRLGERGGNPNRTLTPGQMPSHNHTVTIHCSTSDGSEDDPSGHYLAAGADIYVSSQNANMANPTVGNTGSGQQFSVQNAFLGINFEIALQGVFPSRN